MNPNVCVAPAASLLLDASQDAIKDPTGVADDASAAAEPWETVFVAVVLVGMFAALWSSDRYGADSVTVAALTACLAAGIVTTEQGLAGFANQGLLTAMALFVVGEGVTTTAFAAAAAGTTQGALLHWYMMNLVDKSIIPTAATKTANRVQLIVYHQLRLMGPVAIVSAFLHNTPSLMIVMIPMVQNWARCGATTTMNKNHRAAPICIIQQLLVPLSFAAMLGSTCTLMGACTNLVVAGLLLEERHSRNNDDDADVAPTIIGLFDIGIYGVPVAMAGMAYILAFAPLLLPGKASSSSSGDLETSEEESEDILLGARLTQWSPAAGRTVQRSGLRDTGGIYLVSVYRAATGNVHRAVSNDFALNTGDILYFTGLVETFGEFCDEHGLEVMTNEVEEDSIPSVSTNKEITDYSETDRRSAVQTLLFDVDEDDAERKEGIPFEIGVTNESMVQPWDEAERLRSINRMADMIRGVAPALEPMKLTGRPGRRRQPSSFGKDEDKVVVTIDKDLVVVGIDTRNRPGLLHDISKGLLRLHLHVHHTEAGVVGTRSVSVWRCELSGTELPDVNEIWSVVSARLCDCDNRGIDAAKRRGLRVIRASVLEGSRLIGKTAMEVDFRRVYNAAIVAVRNSKKSRKLSSIRFELGDMLVLQASDNSALLKQPPVDFYKKLDEVTKVADSGSRISSAGSFVRILKSRMSSADFSLNSNGAAAPEDENEFEVDNVKERPELLSVDKWAATEEAIWKDLQVTFCGGGAGSIGVATREFLTAMEIAPRSQLAGKNAAQVDINKFPDLFLVSIERPIPRSEDSNGNPKRTIFDGLASPVGNDSVLNSTLTENRVYIAKDLDAPLQEGDVLWFSGPASAIGNLRKIPGLVSYESEEVGKVHGKIFDRRRVQAVIARQGLFEGKTVKESGFRTRYGAAVIAVHREGKRVHDHPGNVKLHAGDVLLLEAGPSFMAKSANNDKSFYLLAEVENSSPLCLRLLILVVLITQGMLAAYAANLTSLLTSSLVAAVLMVGLGILSEQEARNSINWNVYVIIASSCGIGTAMVNSGIANGVAKFFVHVGESLGIGEAGLLSVVYLATCLISNVFTNDAAAALLFPIAMNAAELTGTDKVTMCFALMFGASASFMSPFGYTTNLLVYGPGGYKMSDFVKFGTPMQLLLWVVTIMYLAVIKHWWVSWLSTGACLAIVIISRIGTLSLKSMIVGEAADED